MPLSTRVETLLATLQEVMNDLADELATSYEEVTLSLTVVLE